MLRAMTRLLLLILCGLFTPCSPACGQTMRFDLHADQIVGRNSAFWKAAGSDHLFYHVTRPSGQALLDRMHRTGSHRYLRTHHTFTGDVGHGVPRGQQVYHEDPAGNPVYDFTAVNRVYREYVKRGIKPIVEYDFIPGPLAIDADQPAVGNDEGFVARHTGPRDWDRWSDLMKAATRNFIDTFGAEEVRTWYFEVWNEPDAWPVEEMDVFFKMYDVFVDAVTSVDPHLKVGGPACYHEYFLRPFLHHVARGTNHVTGQTGTRIDFVSYHIYGLSGQWLNKQPYIHPRVQRFSQAVLWLQRMLKQYPELSGTEFHLNEWGLSSNYYRQVKDYPALAYRNSEESALFLVKLVDALYQIEDAHGLPTSMLLYWGFCGEADVDRFFIGRRELSTAGDVPKPIQTGFEMLARLKTHRLGVDRPTRNSRLGLIATKSDDRALALLAYNYEETDDRLDHVDEVAVTVHGLEPGGAYAVAVTALDRRHNNTYRAWQAAGQPASAAGTDIAAIRDAARLETTATYEATADDRGVATLHLQLERHSMQLVELTR